MKTSDVRVPETDASPSHDNVDDFLEDFLLRPWMPRRRWRPLLRRLRRRT